MNHRSANHLDDLKNQVSLNWILQTLRFSVFYSMRTRFKCLMFRLPLLNITHSFDFIEKDVPDGHIQNLHPDHLMAGKNATLARVMSMPGLQGGRAASVWITPPLTSRA